MKWDFNRSEISVCNSARNNVSLAMLWHYHEDVRAAAMVVFSGSGYYGSAWGLLNVLWVTGEWEKGERMSVRTEGCKVGVVRFTENQGWFCFFSSFYSHPSFFLSCNNGQNGRIMFSKNSKIQKLCEILPDALCIRTHIFIFVYKRTH